MVKGEEVAKDDTDQTYGLSYGKQEDKTKRQEEGFSLEKISVLK
jgi:hypothetical protein